MQCKTRQDKTTQYNGVSTQEKKGQGNATPYKTRQDTQGKTRQDMTISERSNIRKHSTKYKPITRQDNTITFNTTQYDTRQNNSRQDKAIQGQDKSRQYETGDGRQHNIIRRKTTHYKTIQAKTKTRHHKYKSSQDKTRQHKKIQTKRSP